MCDNIVSYASYPRRRPTVKGLALSRHHTGRNQAAAALGGGGLPQVGAGGRAALLVHDALYGAEEAPSSIEETACLSSNCDWSPPRCRDHHGTHPGSHGEVIFMAGEVW